MVLCGMAPLPRTARPPYRIILISYPKRNECGRTYSYIEDMLISSILLLCEYKYKIVGLLDSSLSAGVAGHNESMSLYRPKRGNQCDLIDFTTELDSRVITCTSDQ